MQHSAPSTHNEHQWQILTQYLTAQPPQAELILIQTESLDSRDRWIETCTAHAPQFQHIGLNFSQEQVSSLSDILHSKFADLVEEEEEEIQVQQVVHILHLETSFLHEIIEGESVLVPKLETESSQVMENIPIIGLLWTDAYTRSRIEKEAPTFWESLTATLSFLPEEDESSRHSSPYETLMQLAQQIQEEEQDSGIKHKQFLEIGDIFGRYGRSEEARIWYDKVLESAGEKDDEDGQALAYERIADLMVEDQDLGTALGWYEEALELLEGKDQSEDIGHLHQKVGAVFLRLRNHKKALPHLQQATRAFSEVDAAQSLGETYKQIAKAYEYKGEPTATVEAYESAIEAFARLGDEGAKDLARSYQQIGFIHQGRHNWRQSLEAFRLALPYAQKVEDEFLISAIEDSIENLEEKTQESKGTSLDKGKKKGWLGKLFG